MNKDTVLALLASYLSNYLYDPLLIQELAKILSKTGYEQKFYTLLTARLSQLSYLGIQAVNLEEFENLGGGLFSMHFSRKWFNIRILYGFLPNQRPVLLLAFSEKAGKKITDYSGKIEPAQARFSSIQEEYKNGKL